MKPHIPGRWHAHGLDAPRFTTGAEVVRHLAAVQSQLHDMALWAIGRRCDLTLAELHGEFESGAFVRTHVLRPTWHHVVLDDLWWLQALTADRVHRLNAPQLRQHGITDALLAEARADVPTALDSGPLTRPALGAARGPGRRCRCRCRRRSHDSRRHAPGDVVPDRQRTPTGQAAHLTAREAVEREARAFGAFVGRDARLTISG